VAFKILALNSISPLGLTRLPADRYEVGDQIVDPDAILLRSADLHAVKIPPSVKAIGRAGAGVNNIPVAAMSARGVPVFNTPGANANAVKELVVAALIIGSRHLCQAWDFARGLSGSDEELNKAVEAGKKKFAGTELTGKTLGVVGLGAIGRLVANAGVALGMKVTGFDPGLTVEGAWQLSADVARSTSVDALLRDADFVTVHVPLMEGTRHLLDETRLATMRKNVVVINFAREAIVDEQAIQRALDSGRVSAYVCDFPTAALKNHPKAVTLPHLGASTREAEDNCAVQVVDEVRDFLEHGNVRNAVNFPEVVVPRETPHRFVVANANVPNMLGQISDAFGQAQLNIHDMVNKSRGDLAYTVVDLDAPVPDAVCQKIAGIQGVLMARLIAQ
jgi:D-3-phosphoglycerate dehydrogenase